MAVRPVSRIAPGKTTSVTKHDRLTPPDQPAVAPDDMACARNPWRGMRNRPYFFENAEIAGLISRGLFYARAGVPIHFQGTAGRGKTAIALEVARRLGRPIAVMTGHDWLGADDMIGKEVGQSTRSVIDKYVQRVRRSESTVRYDWENSILADAMQRGHTLVYDEFTRASAKANGMLLSVLEEGVLVNTDRLSDQPEVQAQSDFRIILTSNPIDYAGVNKAPDALLDRMVTFPLSGYTPETEAGIVASRTGITAPLAQRIVALVHAIHNQGDEVQACSMRGAIMIAQIAALRLRDGQLSDALLAQIAVDVLVGRGLSTSATAITQHLSQIPRAAEGAP